MVVMVDKLDAEVTMTMAVVVAPRLTQVRQNFRAHVKHLKGTFLIALTTIKLTDMPPL